MDSLYLDNNASTPVLPAVWEAMRHFLVEQYATPASAHHIGRRARQALEDAREHIAGILDAHPEEVIFTSGATEANNLALFGLAGTPPGQVITTLIEHPSVTEPIRRLEELGFTVVYLPVAATGVARVEALEAFLRPETRLLSVMLANNETGALQPIAELVQHSAFRAPHSAFHCDAVQAVGRRPVRFHELGVTALTLSAHKFHGPKGVGALLLRRGVKLGPQLWGGHQQRSRRPGTEPAALAVGLATALALWQQEHETRE